MSEKIWILKQSSLFQRLPVQELSVLESRSRTRNFPKGSPIYLPADQADGVLLLGSGRVRICHLTQEGKQSIIAFIEPGELFGELAILQPGEREEYAEAAESSTVVLIPRAAMEELMERNPQLTLGITKLVGLRRRRIERRLKNLLFQSNRERLVHLILELAEDYGRHTAEGLDLGIRVSHQDLASIIGSTRETVTVILGELQAEGRLRVSRRRIVLTDVQGLAGSVHAMPPVIPGQRPQNATLGQSSAYAMRFPKP